MSESSPYEIIDEWHGGTACPQGLSIGLVPPTPRHTSRKLVYGTDTLVENWYIEQIHR